ncbi:hypothetical protein EON65_09795 [archaeon]|nr:MAG: hypothetical protein EON65_09795 [archaeon]
MIHPIDLTDRKNVPLDVLDGEEGETAKKISLNPSSILFCPTLPFVLYGNLYSLAILGVHWKDKFTHANHNVTWLTFFGIVICVNIVLWSIYLYHQFLSTGMVAEKYGESRSYSSWYQGFLAYALPMCYALLHLLACARLIQRTILEECPEYTECSYESWKYNSLIENGALSYDGVMLCMIMPIVQLTISGHVAFMCAVVCWTITIGTIIAVMVISKDEDCIVYLLAYIIGCIMIAMEIRKFCVYQSWLQKEMTNTMRKSEEEADRANAIEMRHMIANVAHDLKTVSYDTIILVNFP